MEKSKFDIAIFDCDGVLFDSREANRHYYNKILTHLDISEMNEEQLDFCHMHTAGESLKYLLSDYPFDIYDKAINFTGKLDYADFIQYMTMEPAVEDTVKYIRKYIPTAISTNRSTTMPLLISMYGLDSLFDMTVCALDVINPKPDPEGVLKILSYFDLEPKQAVYIGDSQVDQQVAKNSKVALIAYKNKHLHAMFHVEHFSQIKDILFN